MTAQAAAVLVLAAVVVVGLGYVVVLLRRAIGTAHGAVAPTSPAAADALVPSVDLAAPVDAAGERQLQERTDALAGQEQQFRTRQASLAAFEGRLSELTQSLAASQGELAHREAEVLAKLAELETREAAQQAREADHAAREADHAAREADHDQRAAASVGDRPAGVPTAAQLAELADLTERSEQVAAAAAALARDEQAQAVSRLELAEREAALQQRESVLTERADRLANRSDRLAHREDQLTHREDLAAKDATRLEERRAQLESERSALAASSGQLELDRAELVHELERIAGLTAEAAAAELTRSIADQAKRAAAITVRDLEAEAKRDADRRAREVVSQAIQRVASAQTSESVVSVLHLPGDDMKGRIIGREGRNIRTFETLTGVNVLIDDTPEAVSLSCFDPVRREVARVTLDALIADGRIHPQRIEDAYVQAKEEVEALIDVTGRDTLLEVGLDDAHPELVTLLGRLRYRTSYGQNVLRHLVETAHIAAGMAGELGLGKDGIAVVKRAAFFHDIGKALTHEVEGSHALVGAEVARRCGEREEVVHAIAAHHLEVAPQTVEAWLTIGSDSCSGGRPGARRESLEAYVDRLKRIEEIAYSRDGVERVFAMSAGRELRVMVLPDEVDDLGSQVLARDIAKQIEDELTYPGQIKVTVIRESRASETAH